MKQPKEEFEKTQLEIMNFLFKQTAPTRAEEISHLCKTTKNETEYHLDRLREKVWINDVKLPIGMTIRGEGAVWAIEISSKGRAFIMENPLNSGT